MLAPPSGLPTSRGSAEEEEEDDDEGKEWFLYGRERRWGVEWCGEIKVKDLLKKWHLRSARGDLCVSFSQQTHKHSKTQTLAAVIGWVIFQGRLDEMLSKLHAGEG